MAFEWDNAEDEFLTKNYNLLPAEKIAAALNEKFGTTRSPGAVKTRATNLGIAGQAKAFLPNGGRRAIHNTPGAIKTGVKHLAVSLPWGRPKR